MPPECVACLLAALCCMCMHCGLSLPAHIATAVHCTVPMQALRLGACRTLGQLLSARQPQVLEAVLPTVAALARHNPSCQSALSAAGALHKCGQLMQAQRTGLVASACRALGALVEGNQEQQLAAVAAGAAPQLVQLLQAKQAAVVGGAATALASLLQGCPSAQQAVAVESGAVQVLVLLLLAPHADVRARAAAAIAAAAQGCLPAAARVVRLGGLALLVRLLEQQPPEVVAAAMHALAAVADGCKAHQVGGVALIFVSNSALCGWRGRGCARLQVAAAIWSEALDTPWGAVCLCCCPSTLHCQRVLAMCPHFLPLRGLALRYCSLRVRRCRSPCMPNAPLLACLPCAHSTGGGDSSRWAGCTAAGRERAGVACSAAPSRRRAVPAGGRALHDAPAQEGAAAGCAARGGNAAGASLPGGAGQAAGGGGWRRAGGCNPMPPSLGGWGWRARRWRLFAHFGMQPQAAAHLFRVLGCSALVNRRSIPHVLLCCAGIGAAAAVNAQPSHPGASFSSPGGAGGCA